MLNEPEMPSENSPDAAKTPPPVRVTLDRQVGFSSRDYGGQTSYVAKHSGLGKYFRVGVEEYRIAILLDGSRTIQEVHEQVRAEGLDWSSEDVASFAGELVRQKFAVASTPAPDCSGASAEGQPSASPAQTAPPASLMATLPRYLSMIISQRFPLLDGEQFAKRWSGIVGPLFSKPGTIIWLLLVSSGMSIVYGNFDEFAGELRKLFDPGIWPVLFLFWCIAKVIHESGHAVCAKRHGVRIGRMGVMFFLMAPLAYVDVTDAWKLRSRLKRVHIALAGVYLELAVAAVAAWVWWYLPAGICKHLAAQVFLVAGPTTLLVNANPLLRLDGYYVLSDLLEIPNLRMHGRAQLARRIEWTLFGIQGRPSLLQGWRKPAATFHAFCSVIFQFFWMTGLIVAVSMWARGLGAGLAIVALLLWGILPLARWILKIWFREPSGRFWLNDDRRKMIGYVALLSMIVQHLCFTTSPLDRRVPVVVRFQDEQISRATADAFVKGVYVNRGQRVIAGMLLMELYEPEIILQRDQLVDNLEIAKQRAIQHRNRNELALSAAANEEAASLERQLDELKDQIDGLKVIALRDGLITSMNPQKLLGGYVSKGQELVRVSDPNEKELLAVVTESDMAAYQNAAVSLNASNVRLRGGVSFEATPAALHPRARLSLPHPALAASVGGPVAVEPSPDPDQPMQMIEPQLESVMPLSVSTSLMTKSGQVGTMTISDNRSIVDRLIDYLFADTADS